MAAPQAGLARSYRAVAPGYEQSLRSHARNPTTDTRPHVFTIAMTGRDPHRRSRRSAAFPDDTSVPCRTTSGYERPPAPDERS
jgi:hypothetical protein